MRSHGFWLLATLEVFCRKNFCIINKLLLTYEGVFYKKICEIFLISRFPGKILMCSARNSASWQNCDLFYKNNSEKGHWNQQKDLLRGVLQTYLASWQLQNRSFAEHTHWLLLIFYSLSACILNALFESYQLGSILHFIFKRIDQ